jgi:hypothetical protein
MSSCPLDDDTPWAEFGDDAMLAHPVFPARGEAS